MFSTVVEVQAFGLVHMNYCFSGRFHPLPGRIHGMSTYLAVGASEVASMEDFTEAFVEVYLLPQKLSRNLSWQQFSFANPVREIFVYVHESFPESFLESNITSVKALMKASMEAHLLA